MKRSIGLATVFGLGVLAGVYGGAVLPTSAPAFAAATTGVR